MTLSLESFSLKIVKILEEQAFLNKVKNKRKRTFNNGSENLAKHCVQIVGDKA